MGKNRLLIKIAALGFIQYGLGSSAFADDNSVTADQQGQGQGDVETTRKIRSALMDDQSLSMDARNVKIITRNGAVVLKGPVQSAAERHAVAQIASKVARMVRIRDEMAITAH